MYYGTEDGDPERNCRGSHKFPLEDLFTLRAVRSTGEESLVRVADHPRPKVTTISSEGTEGYRLTNRPTSQWCKGLEGSWGWRREETRPSGTAVCGGGKAGE